MGHSRRVGPIRSAYDAERITMRGTGGDPRPTGGRYTLPTTAGPTPDLAHHTAKLTSVNANLGRSNAPIP
jgi:hypothetical protein